MVLIKSTKDSILPDAFSSAPNYFHNYYQQYYKNVIVENAIYSEHHNGTCVLTTSGFLAENLNLSVIPGITETSALTFALNYLNCNSYSWDSDYVYPIGVLLIIPTTTIGSKYKLVWKFSINGYNPLCYKQIYVNAISGVIENEISEMYEYGDFTHINYGPISNDLDTKRDAGWFSDDFYLFANDDSRNIYTIDDKSLVALPELDWQWNFMPKSAGDDIWTDGNQKATSAHYCAQKSWDFFNKSFTNRNGITGWGKHLRVHGNWDWQEAGMTNNPIGQYINWYDNDHIAITDKDGKNFSTYDVIGHEFTHGIIRRTSQLPMKMVSGAINESFADIFGLMVERYAKAGTYNWTCGEDAITIRDMQNPNNYGDPSYFLQPNFWRNPLSADDNGGVHHNSGVQNKWFYLLSMGGSQQVFGQTRSVSGIGIEKAARIAYLTMTTGTNYIENYNHDFETVRANSISVARQLYGICSNEYNQTCAAWYAVNVGNYCEPCNYAIAWCGQEQQISSSIKERENEVLNVKLFPNPAKDKNYIIGRRNKLRFKFKSL